MGKKQRPQEQVQGDEIFEPTREEVDALEVVLKGFEQKRINGKLASRFEQHAASKGLISFNEFGEIVVRKPVEWREINKVYDKLQAHQWGVQERMYEAFPEKREEDRLKLKAMMADLSKKFRVIS